MREAVYGLGRLIALLAAIEVHDLLTRGRLHPVTLWDARILLGVIIGAGLVLPRISFAQALILWLH